jgi:S-adenosylmethionine hydrolase
VPSPLITLTTDFGLSDHYVGVMKGVISTIAPNAQVVDLCHELPRYGITEAAFAVRQAYRYFPAGTIHLVVVDPGVGSTRRILLVEAADYLFIAPDNGVLSQVFEAEPRYRARTVDTHSFPLGPQSQTFHGRDIFAPLAAYAAIGKPNADFGEIVHNPIKLPKTTPDETQKGQWHGRVLSVDRFGNIVTSLPAEMLPTNEEKFTLRTGNLEVTLSLKTYNEAGNDVVFAIAGSSGYVEISIREQSVAQQYKVAVGDSVELFLVPE